MAEVSLVGRDQEFAEIRAFLDDPRPGALLIQGEAGIGKTTLWRAALDLAERRSLRTLEARPAQTESSLAFAGLGDLFTGALAEVLPGLAAPQRHAVEVALLLREAEGSAPDRRALGVAFLNALRALVRSEPILVAIDDVQWLDPSSANVLEFVLRRLREERVAFMLSHRSELPGPSPLGLDQTALGDRLCRIVVEPLSLGALHRLISAQIDVSLPRPLMRRIHEVSRGNPFFALELARATATREAAHAGQQFPLPDQLHDLLGLRLAGLPPQTREALAVASALSKPTTELVAASLAHPVELEPAVQAQVIEVAGDQVAFTHPLLAAVAYEGISPADRRELHRRLADLVSDAEERAHHLAAAVEGLDPTVAEALEEAAGRAAGRGAPDAAADFCARARAFTEEPGARRTLTLREAEFALQSGDTPRARGLLESLLEATPPGPQRAEVLMDLGRVHFNGLDWRASVGLLEQALACIGDDLGLRAQIELHLAINLDLLRLDVRETLSHAQAAAALAERIDDQTMLGEALALEAKNELLLGRGWPERLVERARELEPATRRLPADRWLADYLASMRGWTDDLDGAIAALEQVQATALEHGDEVSLNWALARAVELKCHAGRWQEALGDVEHGSEIALQAGQRANEAIFLGLTALLHAHLGLGDSARAAGVRALALAEEVGAAMASRAARSGLGLLELSLGNADEAHAHLGSLTAETRSAGVGEPGAMRFVPDAIEALFELGRVDEAHALLGFFEERAHSTGRVSALAAAGRCRGLLTAAEGEVASAEREFEESLERYEMLDDRFGRARTLARFGAAQRRAKRRGRARALLEEAVAGFESLGARLWADLARAELARIGGRPGASGELTPGERRLAELVAEGRSNKEIAAALFVTPKTVGTKLSRIYAKLGVHSRTELVRRLGGGPPSKL